MKAIEQYFHVVLFIMLCQVALTLKSVDETIVWPFKWKLLSSSFMLYCLLFFEVCGWNLIMWPVKRRLLVSTFMRWSCYSIIFIPVFFFLTDRSLVALSLILSMLLFKPAPLYILDEVDAALDLSHTQNIGQMLRAHFKHSQFIVVSLKDGMFNNANVLFKTKFVDGVSTVTRYAQSQTSRDGDGSGALVRGGKSTVKKNPSKRMRADAPSQPLTPSQG